MNGNRMDKLNRQFRCEIANMLAMKEINDPRLAFVSITFVDISKDLSFAHVGFSLLSDDIKLKALAQEALNTSRGRVRYLLGQRLYIRRIPEIKFVHDASIAAALKMDQTLDVLRQEREMPGGDASEGDI